VNPESKERPKDGGKMIECMMMDSTSKS